MILNCRRLVGWALPTVIAAILLSNAHPAVADEPAIAFSVVVDFGEDLGQSFGSIFEARDKQGRLVAGAGFMDAYNTRFRSDRHTIQLFVRHDALGSEFTVKRLPHPDLDCGVYLLDFDENLYAWTTVRDNSVRLWDDSSRLWIKKLPPRVDAITSGDGAMRLGKGILVFSANRVWFDDRLILDRPEKGRYYNFYYAHGHLCFFHTHRGETDGFTKIYACPWTPDSDGPIDLSRAVCLSAKYVGATPFAWGQFRDEVMTVTNQGGVHVFSKNRWRTLLEADNTVSYQVYSMLTFHDRMLLAQYPTGNLFEYQGDEVTRIEGWPPKLPNVSPHAREAQTMAIYRGDLLVGVWPWAELWRYERDAKKWRSMGRAFTHPEASDKTTHPYEAEADRFQLVTNHWGQRITGMVPRGDTLMLSTSSKGTYEWFDKYDSLTEEQRREYGAVLELKMPGNLAAQIKWKDRPTKLEFVVQRNRLVIRQDGQELAAAALRLPEIKTLSELNVNWGEGPFGAFSGSIQEKQFRAN
jgi:hypothetical protein